MSSLAYPLGIPPAPVAPASPAAAPTPAAPMTNPPPAAPVMPAINKPALAMNPQLPQHPANLDPGQLDAQYQAEQAQLAAEISQRYNDVLKNLGYLDPNSGQFVMGRVETEAGRSQAELRRSMALAAERETGQRQLEGTLFSGRRGTEQARAEHPFVQGLADLDIQVPQQLGDLYEQAGNLVGDYTLRQNLLLADAARRRAAGMLTTAYPDPGAAAPPISTVPDPTLDPSFDPTVAPPPADDYLRNLTRPGGVTAIQT